MPEPAAVFDISEFCANFLWPCITIGAILPAGAAGLAALFRGALAAMGYGTYD